MSSQDQIPYDDGGQPMPAQGRPFSPGRLLAAFRRKWWILLITVPLPIVGAYLFTRYQPVEYVSKATMWVRGKMRLADVGQYTEDVQSFFGTQIQLIQSERMQARAVARVKATNPKIQEPKDSMGLLEVPLVKIVQAPKSAVFVLEAHCAIADYAKAYLDALLDEFLLYKKEVRASTSGDALASVSSQVYKQETELKAAQEKMAQFQKDNNIALLEETLRGGGSQLAQLNAQVALLKLDLRLIEATAVEKSAGVNLQTNATSLPSSFQIPGLTSTSTPQPTEFLSVQNQLQILTAQRDQLARNLKPKHPKIIRLNDEISRAQHLVDFYRNQNQDQMTAAREAAKIRIKSMQDTAKELGEKVGDANRRMAEMERIRAEIGRLQSFYDRLLALLQGVDLNSSMNQEDFSVLERASEALPPRSKLLILLAAGAMGGLGLGFGILFLLAKLDDRCDSVVELRTIFAEPVFGQLPDVTTKKGERHLPVIQMADPRHLFVEACRNLRSSLLYASTPDARPKTVLVTSAVPNEGKSTIAVNLASSLAMGGARVLLIDADTRRGHIHDLLDIPSEPGLVDCVRKGGDLTPFIQTTSQPNLYALPRGSRTNPGGELFLDPAFDGILKAVRTTFDFVIIDTIPIFAADDTTTLAPKVDGVLFVVRRDFTSSKMAQEALELLYQRQAKVLGIVLNRVDSRSRSYGYYNYPKYYAESTGA